MSFLLRRAAIAAAVLCAGLLTGGARAEISDFLGNWVNNDSNSSDITRIVVIPTGNHKVAVHVFAQCYPTDCDWGTVPGHPYVEVFTQHDVRIVTAEFNPGFARTLVILRAAPGGLRIQALTEFTDGSGRSDYEYRGQFHRVAMLPPLMPMPHLPPMPLPLQPKWPPAMPTPHPVPIGPINPPGPTPHVPPLQPVQPHPMIPLMGPEDCIGFNPSQVEVKHAGGNWKVVQGSMWMLDFGNNKPGADRAADIIHHYGFDQQCFVKRPHASMTYWKSSGHVPSNGMPGQDCVNNNPAATSVAQVGGAWKVVDGSHWMLDFGSDKAAADQALAVIKNYHLNRQCFVARPNPPMTYWLAE